jgi:hypothetical protein
VPIRWRRSTGALPQVYGYLLPRCGSTAVASDIVTGVGVRQILLEDPSGTLVELFEPLAGYYERPPTPTGSSGPSTDMP